MGRARINRLCLPTVVLLSITMLGQTGPTGAARRGGRRAERTLAELVPSSTGLFVEFVDLGAHYSLGKSSPVWRAAIKLIGLEGGPEDEGSVAGPIGSQLGLSAESAMAVLFGRQVAVALPSMRRVEEGVLLARLPSSSRLGTILQARPWKRQRAGGRLRHYVLESGLSLATDGRTVIIGQVLPEHPFMRACLDLLGRRSGDSLAATESFAELTERFPGSRVGLAYLDWGGDREEGSAALPAMLRRAAVAGVETDKGLHFQLSAQAADGVGPWPWGTAQPGGAGPPVWPKDTWLAATVEASPQELLSWVKEQSASGPGALFIQLLRSALVGAQPDDDLFAYLKAPTTVIVAPPLRSVAGQRRPGLPRVALVMRTQDAAGALGVFDTAMERLIRFVNLRLAAPRGDQAAAGRLRVETEAGSGEPIRYMPLAALASAGDLRDLSRELQLAWGIAGDYFVVASEVRHLRAIRSAVLAGPAVAGPTREGLDRRVAQGPWLSLEARVSKLAGLATQWLDYAARNHPEVLGDEGWARLLARRQRQRVELGAALRPEPNQPGKVRVVGTFRGWPAEGVLRADDLIVGLQGRLLALEDPLGDLRAALAGRAGDTVTLRVERGGRFGDVEVRLYRTAATSAPGENPLLAMEPLLSLAGAIEGLHLSVTPSSTLLCAEMELRFAAVPTVTTISPTSE